MPLTMYPSPGLSGTRRRIPASTRLSSGVYPLPDGEVSGTDAGSDGPGLVALAVQAYGAGIEIVSSHITHKECIVTECEKAVGSRATIHIHIEGGFCAILHTECFPRLGGAPVELFLGTDAVERTVMYCGYAHIVGYVLNIVGGIDHVHTGVYAPVVTKRCDIDVALAIREDRFKVYLYIKCLDSLEGLSVDDRDSVVVGIVRRQLAGDTAGVRYLQFAVVACYAFGLVTDLDGTLHLLGIQIDAVDLSLHVLVIGDGIVAVLVIASVGIGTGP